MLFTKRKWKIGKIVFFYNGKKRYSNILRILYTNKTFVMTNGINWSWIKVVRQIERESWLDELNKLPAIRQMDRDVRDVEKNRIDYYVAIILCTNIYVYKYIWISMKIFFY